MSELTNAQAALMAAVEVEKNNGTTYRYRGQRERVIAERAAEFLALLNRCDHTARQEGNA